VHYQDLDSYGAPLAPPIIAVDDEFSIEHFDNVEQTTKRFVFRPMPPPPTTIPTVPTVPTVPFLKLTDNGPPEINNGVYFDPRQASTTSTTTPSYDNTTLSFASVSALPIAQVSALPILNQPRQVPHDGFFPPQQYFSTAMYHIINPERSFGGAPESLLIVERNPGLFRSGSGTAEPLQALESLPNLKVVSLDEPRPNSKISSTASPPKKSKTPSNKKSKKPKKIRRLRKRRKNSDILFAEELGVLSALTQSVMAKQVEEIIEENDENGHSIEFFHMPEKKVFGFSSIQFDSADKFSYQAQTNVQAEDKPNIRMKLMTHEDPQMIVRVVMENFTDDDETTETPKETTEAITETSTADMITETSTQVSNETTSIIA
jgi:hypothetical protein